jgi:hypothetical protein
VQRVLKLEEIPKLLPKNHINQTIPPMAAPETYQGQGAVIHVFMMGVEVKFLDLINVRARRRIFSKAFYPDEKG